MFLSQSIVSIWRCTFLPQSSLVQILCTGVKIPARNTSFSKGSFRFISLFSFVSIWIPPPLLDPKTMNNEGFKPYKNMGYTACYNPLKKWRKPWLPTGKNWLISTSIWLGGRMLRLDTLVVLAARRWISPGECSVLPRNKSLSRLVFYYLDVPFEVRINVEEVGDFTPIYPIYK